MLADDICSLIVTDGFGTLATNLFKGELPPTPDLCIAVMDYQGGPAVTFFGSLTVNENPRVQVKVRGAADEYDIPRTRIEHIYQAFMDRGAFTVNSTRYLNIGPVQPPFPLGKDDNNRWVFVVNFDVMKERTSI